MEGLEAASKEVAAIHLQLVDALQLGRTGQFAWQLQLLTDLEQNPDYTNLDSPEQAANRFAPVNEAGEPILYSTPDTWDAAQSDGERMRWSIEQAKQSPGSRFQAINVWASFLDSQFSVNTLQQDYWFFRRPADEDAQERDAGVASLHTLSEEETVAKLANGIHRFKLADEFNPIRQYQEIAKSDDGAFAQPALQNLHNTFLNRRQYSKAAEQLQESIRRFGDDLRSSKRTQLNTIIKPRMAFDPV